MDTLTVNINNLAKTVDNNSKNTNKTVDNLATTVDNLAKTVDQLAETVDTLTMNVDQLAKTADITLKKSESTLKTVDKFILEMRADRKISIQYLEEQTKSIKSMNQTINSYIKNEADLIENEINEYVRTYLTKHDDFKGCKVFDLTKTWQFLNKPTMDEVKPKKYINKTPITQFDGIYIISNDATYYPKNTYEEIREITTEEQLSQEKYKQFMVVEAKHSITTSDIKKKVAQMEEFLKYMQTDITKNNLTIEFLEKVENLQLNTFKKEILLVFGSENMDDERITQIQDNYITWKGKGIYVSYMKLNGNRYGLFDGKTKFTQNRFIYANSVSAVQLKIGAGKTKKRKTKNYSVK